MQNDVDNQLLEEIETSFPEDLNNDTFVTELITVLENDKPIYETKKSPAINLWDDPLYNTDESEIYIQKPLKCQPIIPSTISTSLSNYYSDNQNFKSRKRTKSGSTVSNNNFGIFLTKSGKEIMEKLKASEEKVVREKARWLRNNNLDIYDNGIKRVKHFEKVEENFREDAVKDQIRKRPLYKQSNKQLCQDLSTITKNLASLNIRKVKILKSLEDNRSDISQLEKLIEMKKLDMNHDLKCLSLVNGKINEQRNFEQSIYIENPELVDLNPDLNYDFIPKNNVNPYEIDDIPEEPQKIVEIDEKIENPGGLDFYCELD